MNHVHTFASHVVGDYQIEYSKLSTKPQILTDRRWMNILNILKHIDVFCDLMLLTR